MRARHLELDDRNEDLRDLLEDHPAVAREFEAKYEASWLYHDSALEGVVVSGHELALALAGQPIAEATTLAVIREIRNVKAAIDLVRSEARAKKLKINLTLVKRIYETLGAGIEGKDVAEYRREIPLHRSYFHEIAPPAKVPALLQKLLDATEAAEWRGLHPIFRAARISHGLMQIYPFTENSGKVARLLANMILLHAGHLPCIVHATDRQRYYESLRGSEAALREVMLDSMANGLANAEKLVRQSIEQRRKKTAR